MRERRDLGGRPVYSGRVLIPVCLVLEGLIGAGAFAVAGVWIVTDSAVPEYLIAVAVLGFLAVGAVVAFVLVIRRRGFPIAYVIPDDTDDLPADDPRHGVERRERPGDVVGRG